MNKNDILKKIGVIINELQEQYAYAEENADDINDLELELFVANAHFLTDHLEILRKLYNKQIKPLRQEALPSAAEVKPEPVISSPPEKRYFEPMVQPIAKKEPPVEYFEPEAEDEVMPEEVAPQEPETIEEAEPAEEGLQELPHMEEEHIIPIIRHELIFDEPASELPEEEKDEQQGQEEEWIDQELSEMELKPEEQPEEPELINEHIEETQPVAENLAEPESTEPEQPENEPEPEVAPEPEPEEIMAEPEQEIIEIESVTDEEEDIHGKTLTLNEILAAQRAAEIPELPPIKDIKSAINLNDKLLYVRDLFNGYSMAYGEAIEILNRFNRYEEADQFLKINYYNKNNWEAKQDTADKFYVLLRRRFPDQA